MKPSFIKSCEKRSSFALKPSRYAIITGFLLLATSVWISRLRQMSTRRRGFLPWRTDVEHPGGIISPEMLRLPPDGKEPFPPYTSPNGASGCEIYDGEDRNFCEVHVGSVSKENFQEYLSAVAACEWDTEDPHDNPDFIYQHVFNHELSSSSGYAHFGYEISQERINEFRNKLQLKTCDTVATGRDGNSHQWTVSRLGPFYGKGGYDWHRHATPNVGHLLEKGPLYVTGFMAAAVDPNGKVLGMPPIHVHHTHTASNQCWLIRKLYQGKRLTLKVMQSERERYDKEAQLIDWEFDTHGDRECTVENGGSACLLQILPDGYANRIDYPLCSLGDWNDMRPEGSPEIEFWIENAFRWTHVPQKEISMMTTGIGFNIQKTGIYQLTESFLHPHLAEEAPSMFDDYLIPVEDSMIWGSIAPGISGQFKAAYFHTHHLWTKDILAFTGKPEQFGLNQAPFILPNHYTPQLMDTIGVTMIEAKRYIYNNMLKHQEGCADKAKYQESCPRLFCQLNQNRFDSGDHWPLGIMGGVLYNKYERFAYPKCEMLEFRKGDIFTMITFHGTAAGGPPPKPGKTRMHSGLYGKIAPIPPEAHIPASFHFKSKELTVGMFTEPGTILSETTELWLRIFQRGFHTMV